MGKPLGFNNVYCSLQAAPAKSISEVMDRLIPLGPFVCEYKYDGARVQIHVDGDDTHVFSRSGEQFAAPITKAVTQLIKLSSMGSNRSFILVRYYTITYHELGIVVVLLIALFRDVTTNRMPRWWL